MNVLTKTLNLNTEVQGLTESFEVTLRVKLSRHPLDTDIEIGETEFFKSSNMSLFTDLERKEFDLNLDHFLPEILDSDEFTELSTTKQRI
jgi:hypothetical protein